MQGIDATFDDLSFEGGEAPRRALIKILPGVAAVALAGAVSVWVLHWRGSAPETIFSKWTEASTSAPTVSRPFRDIAIDKALLAQLSQPVVQAVAPARQRAPQQQVATLETAPPPASAHFALPELDAFPPAPVAVPPTPQAIAPLPPARDLPEISEPETSQPEEAFPLPPARPPELAAPSLQPSAPLRRLTRPEIAVAPPGAPADNRNIFQKMFGWSRTTSPDVASATPSHASTSPAVQQRERETNSIGRGPLFSFPSPFGNSAPAPVSGYDRYTAVYDITNRVVYLPDGTRLEAHSGLGQALDDPRYVAQRAVGPTPPHLYQLTLREGSFHGVQAIRLNPVGEGGIFGRAGLLAHPFMLGPNGDSNGCVSFKDYAAFLRAYENGQITNLAVVAKL
jgi:hypothetical protein